MRGPHGYQADCMCYKCKGIRNAPPPRNFKLRGARKRKVAMASREEQNARYLACGPQNWDDRDNPDY